MAHTEPWGTTREASQASRPGPSVSTPGPASQNLPRNSGLLGFGV